METFQERFCQAHGCPPERFVPRVFNLCLHRRAVLFAPLFGGVRSDFFSTDRELLKSAALATTLTQVHEEIRDYRISARGTSWFHRNVKLRLSGRRLIILAESLA